MVQKQEESPERDSQLWIHQDGMIERIIFNAEQSNPQVQNILLEADKSSRYNL